MSDSSSPSKVVKIAETLCGNGSCPTVYVLFESGRAPRLILQGYDDLLVPTDTAKGTKGVRINQELAKKCVEILTANRWQPNSRVAQTTAVFGYNRELVVMGREITDAETLAKLPVPPSGESIIEVDLGAFEAGDRLLQFAGYTAAPEHAVATADLGSISASQPAAPLGVQL